MKKKKSILLAAVAVSMLMNFQTAKAENVGTWTELRQTIVNGTTPIDITGNITAKGDLGTLGGSNNTVTINGNGYDITAEKDAYGNNQYVGITVNSGQTLNINNVGNPAGKNSNGFNGFTNSYGGAIANYNGTVTITGTNFTGNSAVTYGGAIYNELSSLYITGSNFTGNSARDGGAIYTQKNGTTTITDSTFIGNLGTGSYGGAINNNGGTTNIIANESNTTFTGNSLANGKSNALHNSSGPVNINAADGYKVVFNDGIDGSKKGIININNTGVRLSDGTKAKTDGIVEFNNTVQYTSVNLYDGTLKLGTHTYTAEESSVLAGQTGYGNFDNSVNFNVHGGTLSLQDGGARTTNLGNLTLSNDLLLAIDAASSSTDMITANSFNAGGHKILISDINLRSAASYTGTAISTDSNIYNNVGLSSDIKLSGDGFANTNALVSYDNTKGTLRAGTSTLARAVADTAADRVYTMNTDEEVASNLGTMGGDASTLTINGNGHNINGNSNVNQGITVNSGQNLNINRVGSEGSNGFNGFFKTGNGGAIFNNGTTTITGSAFTKNLADSGGAIFNGDTATITGSTFTGNSTINGGAIDNDGTATITDSSFIGNSAWNGGGAIDNDGTATITDSSFTGNSAWNGGAIFNIEGTANIIANESDTTFTGNTANGVSNALYNVYATANLNAAGEHKVIFNDGIDGNGGTININGGSDITGISTPTSGTVAINNEVKNNTVNLHNGTLKLGHYEGGTITVGEEQRQVVASVGSLADTVDFNVYGGTLSLQDGGTRTTNIGNVTLENDLQLAIDADLANETADMITASSAITDNGNSIQISEINILSEAQKDIVSTEVADSNTKNAVTLSSDVAVSKADGIEKNYLLAYDNSGTTGILTFDSSNNLINAVRRTATERVYNMVAEEIVNETLGTMGGDGSTLTINGGGYDITAEGNNIGGITVNNGQTLNINNVGNPASEGFNGFNCSYGGAIYNMGGAIYNMGTATITDSSFTENFARFGSAIYNEDTATITGSIFTGNKAIHDGGAIFNNGTATITDSTFTGNSASYGGAIHNRGTASITGSTFTGNSTDSRGGAISNEDTATITDSTFTGNKATNGGTIYNAFGSTVIITDSTFTGNSASYGGAIFNEDTATITDSTFIGNSAGQNSGAIANNYRTNIIADKNDTTFTGNMAGGVSNALYNDNATININAAGEHRVVFNDGIDGNGGTININNTGVMLPAGTEAGTDGTVEFNNTVSNNTVNLYNGTLKLGHYAGGTIDVNGVQKEVAESWGNFDNSVTLNLNGGTLDTLDGAIRDYTVGTLNGSGSTLALDVNFAADGTATADNFTINGGDATINFSNMNITGDLPTTSGTVEIVKGADDNITLGNYAVFTNDASLTFTQDAANKGALAYTYDEAQGGLKAAVDYAGGNRQYDMSESETITEDLGVMQGDGSTLTINGNGHDINGNHHQGIIVYDKQTLNITNIGSNGSEGLNGFIGGMGGAIQNQSNAIITGSTLTENSASFGGAIYNTATTTVTGSIFSKNSASFDGGAIENRGTATIIDSAFIENSASLGGAIDNSGGTVNIIANESDTIFTGNTANGVSNALYNSGAHRDAVVNINAASEHRVIFNDGIDGRDATININGNSDITGISAPTSGTVAINNEVKNNTVNMYNGTLNFGTNTQYGTLYTGTFADSVNFNYNGGTVSLQNGGINSANLGNLTLNSDMNLRLDANLANQTMDTITASGFTQNGHNINISNILITEPTTEKSFSISPLGTGMDESVRSALAGAIQYTGGDIVYSPIYRYSAAYDASTAMMNFGLAGGGGGGYTDFSPAIMASPVAAQLGGYLVQLNAYDNAFRNMDMYMLMTKEQRQAMKMRNRYATTNKDIVFDPTVTQYENKAGWFRPYATFENVSLNNGPKVSNVAYGSFFGAESELYDLGHGWDGMWGVYGGYNGSHQAYDGVSIYQNGGTIGAVGMAYKGNFFTGLTANVGASAGEASTMFGREDFAMLMTGVASKTGYNWELAKSKFIIQPSLLMSYSFINTFDYRNAAGVSINSDPLHAIQLEPGIKFIGNLKNGWQPYAGVSVVWNIMDRTHFKANDVSLPNLSIDPFVKYGVGVRKAWGEKFTGFFQTYITNGGRNGVGLQAGFRWTLGKSAPKQQKANATQEIPKAQITLQGNK